MQFKVEPRFACLLVPLVESWMGVAGPERVHGEDGHFLLITDCSADQSKPWANSAFLWTTLRY